MNQILDVVEDIKENITDNQYKTIMETLMEIHKTNKSSNLLPLLSVNQKLNKFASFFNWLDTKLEITESKDDRIKRRHLHNYVAANYFKYFDVKDFNFVKTLLKIYLTFSIERQGCNFEYIYYENVKNRIKNYF